LVYDSGLLKLFFDGLPIDSENGDPSANLISNTDPYRTGCDYDRCGFPEPPTNIGLDYLFHGKMDEVMGTDHINQEMRE